MARNVDISQLYDKLREMADTYVLCCDIVGLHPINTNHGYKAGDKMILEALKRLDTAAGDDMLLFRIGGDEFALVTGLTDKNKVDKLAERIISRNGENISCDGVDLPLAMRIGAFKYQSRSIRYHELFDSMQKVINNTRDQGKVVYFE